MTWKILRSNTAYQNRFMTVTEDELITDHGDHVSFGVVHKNPAVMIIPWDGVRVALIGQYRYPIDQWSWEFPAGHMEHTDIQSAAIAELEEETGMRAEKLVKIGEFAIAPGHNTQICHAFVATGLSAGIQHLEPAEKGMQVKSVSMSELDEMVIKHEIIDGLTLTSLKFFELYLQKQP